MVGNYFKYGPATKSGVKYRILEPSDSVARWYISDNYVDGNPTISANNWNGGIQGTYASKPSIKMVVPFAFAPVYTQSAVQAYEAVLASAGACLPKRDTVDARVVYETRMRTATYDGKTYEIKQGLDTSVVRGIIDTQNDVGGWPVLVSTAPPADTDHDGMPDEWELAHRLNPNNPEDRNVVGFSGYTKLEEYLNELAGTPTMVRTGTELPTKIELLQNFPNPFNPKTEIRYWVLGVRDVRISIYDLLGREVAVLVDEKQDAGSYRVQWDASRFSSGVYVCMLISGEHRAVKKMSLIR
jgi:hypothetical protein